MDRTERFYKIDHLLHERGLVTTREFLEELEVSLATFKRDLEYMKDRHHAPIEFDREAGGYRFVKPDGVSPKYELPGLWFNPREAQALLTMHHLLESLGPSLLGGHLEPIKSRLETLLATGDRAPEEVRSRIRLMTTAARRHEPKHFELVAAATLNRQRIHINYWNRMQDEVTERDVSPQRLVHYRENWYLDGWCHLRNGLRSFSLDAMRGVNMVAGKVKECTTAELDETLGVGYGIFGGTKVQWATLKFSARRARYVANEEWHPKQKLKPQKDGTLVMELPYSQATELIEDILRMGEDVEVLEPAALREAVSARARAVADLYR